jgi:hypothetical protein
MTQFINPKPVAAMANMGARPDPYTQGMGGVLSLAEGGLARKPYLFGGIKRRLKKLIPKEAAGIMQVAAPFVAPHSLLGAGIMSGLGQYKQSGRINPLQLAMSVAPGLTRGNLSSMTGGRFGVEGSSENLLRNLMQRSPLGSNIDTTLFGPKQMNELGVAEKGWIGEGGNYNLGNLLKKGIEGVVMKGPADKREVDKMALAAIGLAGASYMEAKKQMQLSGEDLEDYGIYNSDDWESIDWSETFKDSSYLPDSFAQGGLARVRHAMGSEQGKGLGSLNPNKQTASADSWSLMNDAYETYEYARKRKLIPMDMGFEEFIELMQEGGSVDELAKGGRVGYAMGSAQFPPQKRTGLQWGSDKGEGLGGEEVEADMRYTGGFMPYGDKPKADDVPARLSKDEFVFTDEAVAGMGGGDVNLGAERLYNMMKNLEQQGAPGQMGIGAMV